MSNTENTENTENTGTKEKTLTDLEKFQELLVKFHEDFEETPFSINEDFEDGVQVEFNEVFYNKLEQSIKDPEATTQLFFENLFKDLENELKNK